MTGDHRPTLTRDDIVAGLRELIAELASRGQTARIRLVGGAAIALTVDADRPSTVDIDAPLDPTGPVLEAAAAIAARHGWRADWINDAATMFLPNGLGRRTPEWRTVHQGPHVTVQVASPDTLLAMKLHAAQRRGNRDASDLAALLPLCGITSLEAAEQLYEDFYPGDELTERSQQLVRRLLDTNQPAKSQPVVPPLD